MQSLTRQLTFVYVLGLSLLFLVGCGPQAKLHSSAQDPIKEIMYEDEEASPTVVIPKTTSENIKYQSLPKKIINNNRHEIILGEAELQNTKVSYDPIDRKMIISGAVIMLNDLKQRVTEKSISLTGMHAEDQNSFILKDENETASDSKTKMRVRAQANCLDTLNDNRISCNHVIIDVYVHYNNKFYTEQIEVNRKKQKVIPPAVAPTPSTTEIPLQDENKDQLEIQQPEDNDDSIDGRYQGGAETIDLEYLFPPIDEGSAQTPKAKPKAVHDKILSPDLKQTKEGDVRPINQAIGFPDKGRLRNATSILARQQALNKKAFFEVTAPDRKKHYSTFEMAEIITRTSDELHKEYAKKLYVSNLSAVNGGKLSPHVSHQNGLDADFAYPTDIANIKFPLVVQMKTNAYFPKNYSIEKTYNLFKFLFTQKDILVDRIFVDQKIKNALCRFAQSKNEFNSAGKVTVKMMFENIQHVSGHGDHFHLRIKCSKSDPACRGRIYRKMDNCSSNLNLAMSPKG